MLGLADVVLRDIPPPDAELACIPGVYDSDEGAVEVFSEGGKLHFRIPGVQGVTGVIARQGRYSYAIDENRRVRFLCDPGHSRWAQVYSGGLMVDAKRAPPATVNAP